MVVLGQVVVLQGIHCIPWNYQSIEHLGKTEDENAREARAAGIKKVEVTGGDQENAENGEAPDTAEEKKNKNEKLLEEKKSTNQVDRRCSRGGSPAQDFLTVPKSS